MRSEAELRHVDFGPAGSERPSGILLELDAVGSGGSRQLLARAREVMRAVLSNGDPWPDLEAWRQVLPSWFVLRCAPEQTKEEAERWLALAWWRKLPAEEMARATDESGWSLANWLYWLEPEQREWYWWDGRVVDHDTARIVVDAQDVPATLGALEWLLKAAGLSVWSRGGPVVRAPSPPTSPSRSEEL